MAFQPLGNGKPFTSITQDTVDLLESVTAAEKAMAVPHLKIWQVDRTGAPVHGDAFGPTAPLTLQLVQPPHFGASLDDGLSRFRERPPVSLERVSIKSQNPNGVIQYRVVSINFMVHRPDVIFGDVDPTVDSFSAMIIPGNLFVMEYGWRAGQGVKNGILNGDGFDDKQGHIVPGTGRIKFIVTNYRFKIHLDSQISIDVEAYEDGEFNVRQALTVPSQVNSVVVSGQKTPIANVTDPHQDPQFTGVLQQTKDKVRGELFKLKRKGQNGRADLVTVQDIADVLFAPIIEDAYRRLGYRDISLYMGYFNDRVGIPSDKYQIQSQGGPVSIGDFQLPFKDVEEIFNRTFALGNQLTIYNFLVPLLSVINDFQTWDRSKAAKNAQGIQEQTLPEVAVKTITNGGSVNFYMVDQKREFTRFSSSDQLPPEQLVAGKVTRDAVKNVCRNAQVPFVSFQKGNSYIEDSSFDVIADEQIKALFMLRYLEPDRKDITRTPDIQQKQGTGVDPRQVLYSSAISGEITMLGNFAFDVFQLLWLDFGVRQWDGPFKVAEREDVVAPGSFVTKIRVVSEGNDPLGTQGRLDQTTRGSTLSGLPVGQSLV